MMENMQSPLQKEMLIPYETSYLKAVRTTITEFLEDGPFPKSEINLIQLAVDEAVANIMEHSEDKQKPDTIEMCLELDKKVFKVILRDNGRQFDPMTVKSPNIKEHVKEGKKRGLGLLLIRQIMDEITYSFINGVKNELRMVKNVK